MLALYDRRVAASRRMQPKVAQRRVVYQAEYSHRGPATLGFELELEIPRQRTSYLQLFQLNPVEMARTRVWADVCTELRAHITNDGSLDHGYEVVMPPATLVSWKKLRPGVEAALRTARKCGHLALSSCGLHVHISRSAFHRTRRKQHVTELVRFLRRERQQVRALAGRRSSFASFAAPGWQRDVDLWCARRGNEWSATKYRAAAFTHVNTVEFRVFKGTLEWRDVERALEFTAAVVEYTKTPKGRWPDFRKWVAARKTTYPVLANYLRRPACV